MLKRIQNLALILVGISYLITALTLIATLKPGGIILGLLFLGLGIIIYFFKMTLKTLLQIRELLMLSITSKSTSNQTDELPSQAE